MHLHHIPLVLSVLILAACRPASEQPVASSTPGPSGPQRLALDAATVASVPTRPNLYGHNLATIDWHGTIKGRPILWDIAGDRPDPAWDKLTHAFPLRLMRYHSGNNYAWRDVIGPVGDRKAIAPSEKWASPYRPEAGLDEFLRWIESLPYPTEVSLIASPLLPAQDLADLVAYCNSTTGPMAGLRAANGHPAPYAVKYWEMGNETDWHGRADLDIMRPDTEQEKSGKLLPTEYAARCHERIVAMRAVDPTIKIYAHAQTSPWSINNPKWPVWHQEVIRKIGAEIDGIVIHPYYDGYMVPYVLASVDKVIADIKELQPPGKNLSVAITEHSRWTNPEDNKKWPLSWGLQGAISAGDFLLRAMARPEIESANYWCYLHQGPWRVLNTDWKNPDAPKFGTGAFYLFQLLNDAALPSYRLLTPAPAGASSAAGYPYSVTAGLFSDSAGTGRALVAINRDNTRPAILTVAGLSIPASVTKLRLSIITADSLTASNVPETPDAVVATTHEIPVVREAGGSIRFELPPRAVASWRW